MPRRPTDRPNVVLINCDDLGYGDLGCYGSGVHATPAVDRLAAEGMLFTDFCMPASVCTPSRAGMLTGCYPHRIGMDAFGRDGEHCVLFPGHPEGLHPDEISLGTLLRRQGYATKLVGKWHVGDQRPFLPCRHGFDAFYGLPYSNDMGMQIRWPAYPPLPLMDGDAVVEEQPDQATLTERYVEQSVRFIRAHRDEPFFLYLAHMYVHVPLFVPEHFLRGSRNGQYGAAVECVDWATAAILHELRRQDLERNTVVIFTSDNGASRDSGGSNAPLRGYKATIWEGGYRVPLLMRWPGVIPAGQRHGELATAMDLLPTLAALAGTAPPTDRVIDGRDLTPLFRGETVADKPLLYYMRDAVEAIRDGDWKLHLSTGELYDLRRDIGETADVAGANPGEVARLRALAETLARDIDAHRRPCGRVEHPVPLTQYDPDHPYIVAMYDSGGNPRPRAEQYAQPHPGFDGAIIGPRKTPG